jgi:DNA-directed RNA polymerase subunit N (RpoN/RPB10)
MIIPVRCVTCGKVLADKYEYYHRESQKIQDQKLHLDDLKQANPAATGAVLDQLGLTRICCRRHMLAHVDLIDDI